LSYIIPVILLLVFLGLFFNFLIKPNHQKPKSEPIICTFCGSKNTTETTPPNYRVDHSYGSTKKLDPVIKGERWYRGKRIVYLYFYCKDCGNVSVKTAS